MNKWYPVALIMMIGSWLPQLPDLSLAGGHRALSSRPHPGVSTPRHTGLSRHPDLVDRFYLRRNNRLFWFGPATTGAAGRQQLIASIDSAAWQGLDSNAYHPALLRQLANAGPRADSLLLRADRQYTGAALSLA
ncbi:MAG TPA: hypothetical protein VKQ52_11255, partial [Puia sp.]|nr:hypothetical protein [Puia sp.]